MSYPSGTVRCVYDGPGVSFVRAVPHDGFVPTNGSATPAPADGDLGRTSSSDPAERGSGSRSESGSDSGSVSGSDSGVESGSVSDSESGSVEEIPPPKNRMARWIRDMALSMAVLVVPLVLVVAGYQWLTAVPASLDPAPAYAQARATAKFPIRTVAPPAEWEVATADAKTVAGGVTTLRIGFRTVADAGARVIQSDQKAPQLFVAELGGVRRPTGTVTIGANRWQVYDGRSNETAYGLTLPTHTILVIAATGSGATVSDLRTLAQAAHP